MACGTPPPPEPEPEQPEIPDPPIEAPADGDLRTRTVYVPAYSHLPRGTTGQTLLWILLSVRNVDTVSPVTLTHVDYFDTSGHRVRRYLSEPRVLRPLETAEFKVETTDRAGGSGANFLVYWQGPNDTHPLLTEAIMAGQVGPGYAMFTSRGVELDRRPDPTTFVADEASPDESSDEPAPDPASE